MRISCASSAGGEGAFVEQHSVDRDVSPLLEAMR
jgi:hypothetical protein